MFGGCQAGFDDAQPLHLRAGFNRTRDDLAILADDINQLPGLVGKNGKAYLTALDSKNEGSNTFEYEVGEAAANYRMVFKIDNLKILNREYEVRVSAKGISHFRSTTGDVEYWIATESSSKYGD